VIARWGGVDPCVREPSSLLHVLESIRGSVFGVDRYPTLEEKACAVAYAVARHHVFADGNKRTAAESLFAMLELNGRTMHASDDEIVGTFEGIADDSVSFDSFVAWVRRRLA